ILQNEDAWRFGNPQPEEMLNRAFAATAVPTLYHGWSSPVPGCSTTTANKFEYVAGYSPGSNQNQTYLFNANDSAACKAWKLAATVCTTEPVGYGSAPQGDFYCPSAGGGDTGFCAVPNQYACSNCDGACNAGA